MHKEGLETEIIYYTSYCSSEVLSSTPLVTAKQTVIRNKCHVWCQLLIFITSMEENTFFYLLVPSLLLVKYECALQIPVGTLKFWYDHKKKLFQSWMCFSHILWNKGAQLCVKFQCYQSFSFLSLSPGSKDAGGSKDVGQAFREVQLMLLNFR